MVKKLSEKVKLKRKEKRIKNKQYNKRNKDRCRNSKDAKLPLFDYQNQQHKLTKPPKVIIIIPVRNRDAQKLQLSKFYKGCCNIKAIFINQNWDLPFNKGAMINIGFFEIKKLYPSDYENITLVIHDVDVIPYINIEKKEFFKTLIKKFTTQSTVIKHIYGFNHTLGGIISILAKDFEKVKGFPNVYGWGNEDYVFNNRILLKKYNFKIDRNLEHFISADKGDTVLHLSNTIPFDPEYRIFFISEDKRGKSTDTYENITSYEAEVKGEDVYVKSFKTLLTINLDKKNIRVLSKHPLPNDKLCMDVGNENNKFKDDWYISQWCKEKHGELFKLSSNNN